MNHSTGSGESSARSVADGASHAQRFRRGLNLDFLRRKGDSVNDRGGEKTPRWIRKYKEGLSLSNLNVAEKQAAFEILSELRWRNRRIVATRALFGVGFQALVAVTAIIPEIVSAQMGTPSFYDLDDSLLIRAAALILLLYYLAVWPFFRQSPELGPAGLRPGDLRLTSGHTYCIWCDFLLLFRSGLGTEESCLPSHRLCLY
jgi:hypothetical protein